MSDDIALVDSNVLVYALYQESENHLRCRDLLERAQAGQVDLCVAPQNLAEFYAVVTDSCRVAIPRKPSEAVDAIERFLVMPSMTLLLVPGDVIPQWLDLIRRRPVTRGAVFDLQLIATMLGNGVRKVYTFNRSDFEPFDEIEVLTP